MRYTLLLFGWFMSFNLTAQQPKKEYLLHGVDDSLDYRLVFNQDFFSETVTLSTKGLTLKIFGVQDLKSQVVHENVFLELQFRVRSAPGGKI